jgi:hypothetical protein
MLAPIVIDLLYICSIMLVSGWVLDTVQANMALIRRNNHATAVSCAKLSPKCTSRMRSFHA